MRFLYFILLIYCLPIKAQQLNETDKIIALYDSVSHKAPREKLYVLHRMLEQVRAAGYPNLLPWVPTEDGEIVVYF